MAAEDRTERQIVTYVDPSVKVALTTAADREGRSVSNYVARVLTAHSEKSGSVPAAEREASRRGGAVTTVAARPAEPKPAKTSSSAKCLHLRRIGNYCPDCQREILSLETTRGPEK